MSTTTAFQRVREAHRGVRASLAIGLASAFWIATAVVIGGLLLQHRNETLERATRNAAALAMVLEAHTARTFQAVDATLAGVADALRLAPKLRKSDPVFQRALARRVQALHPYVRGIFVVGPDGRIVHDTDYPATPDLSLADRPYFEAHRSNPALEHSVSSPLQSRSGLGWYLAVTRRISGDNGEFRGIAVAAVQPQYFEGLYRRMGLDDADVITLFHRDGTLIARYPGGADQVGRSFAGFPLFARHLPHQAAGSYVADRGFLNFERLVSYRALEEAPFVVVVGQEMSNLLGSWRIRALGAVISMAGLMLLLAALVVLFLRQQRLRDLARERSAQSEKLEALGHFTGSVSHDFGNLLNVLGASLRIIGLEAQAPRAREALAVAERAVMRGSQLIDRLRAFARRQPIHVQQVHLEAVIGEGRGLLRQLVGPEVRIEVHLSGRLDPCMADETELEVALVNLLVNAKDAGARVITLKAFNCSRDYGPLGRKAQRTSDYVCLSVCDDGRGMPEAVKRRAFEPYFTTKGKAGTGLGLSQVYGFMRQIGGEVRIESQPDKGSAVHLLFPKARQSPVESNLPLPA